MPFYLLTGIFILVIGINERVERMYVSRWAYVFLAFSLYLSEQSSFAVSVTANCGKGIGLMLSGQNAKVLEEKHKEISEDGFILNIKNKQGHLESKITGNMGSYDVNLINRDDEKITVIENSGGEVTLTTIFLKTGSYIESRHLFPQGDNGSPKASQYIGVCKILQN